MTMDTTARSDAPERCDECGFDYAGVPAGQVPARLRAFGPAYVSAVAAVADVRRRPAPHTWSALEYACHVRDVFRVQLLRLELALREDEPTFASMGRDELAVSSRYNEQEPKLVLAGLAGAADALAGVFGALGPGQLDRTGAYP